MPVDQAIPARRVSQVCSHNCNHIGVFVSHPLAPCSLAEKPPAGLVLSILLHLRKRRRRISDFPVFLPHSPGPGLLHPPAKALIFKLQAAVEHCQGKKAQFSSTALFSCTPFQSPPSPQTRPSPLSMRHPKFLIMRQSLKQGWEESRSQNLNHGLPKSRLALQPPWWPFRCISVEDTSCVYDVLATIAKWERRQDSLGEGEPFFSGGGHW